MIGNYTRFNQWQPRLGCGACANVGLPSLSVPLGAWSDLPGQEMNGEGVNQDVIDVNAQIQAAQDATADANLRQWLRDMDVAERTYTPGGPGYYETPPEAVAPGAAGGARLGLSPTTKGVLAVAGIGLAVAAWMQLSGGRGRGRSRRRK